MIKIAVIKYEHGSWNVYSKSGKHMGGPYKTKEEATERLRQIEYFKHHKAHEERLKILIRVANLK